MTLNVVAMIDAKPEFVSEIELALREMLVPTRAEPGCLQYELTRDMDSPTRLVMVERWQDVAALDAHTATPHMARLREAMAGRIEQVNVCRLQPVA
jgi:quinol monooxygenase YgiN